VQSKENFRINLLYQDSNRFRQRIHNSDECFDFFFLVALMDSKEFQNATLKHKTMIK